MTTVSHPERTSRGCCYHLKTSRTIVVGVVCIAMFTDSLLLTLVDPILPKMLLRIEEGKLEMHSVGLFLGNKTMYSSSHNNTADYLNQGGKFGFLVAAKGAAQFICNPFVGHVTSRFGYRSPMMFGSVLLAGSTLAFGYSVSYWMLMICRLVQGLASSLTAVTSLGLLADTFRDDIERGKVVGYAFGGLSMGIIAGPIYGSLLYDFVSPEFPFQLLSGIMGLSVGFRVPFQKDRPGAIFKLIADPYILIIAANIFLLNLDTSIVLAFLPLELMRLADPPTWQLGIVVLPTSVGYLLAGVICPRMVKVIPRWTQGLAGMFISAGTLMALAYSFTFVHMVIVTSFLGLAIGMISTSMQPIFAYIVDIRHSDRYGNVYAISDMAVCLSMFLGPLVGGPVLYGFGIQVLLFGAAILDLLCAPLCVLLKSPTPRIKARI
ncbi:LOW QUALITY PROTEIN: synaptic vesicular amine transporter-like [Liolophura sinensis]|uniref:LOW QUALITY PROTEIN: synaptic vesicular amine transporter-like n=1 Tax=Liolophura sinensis TaxID=3198878 RepID=UPI0031589F88